MDNLSRMDQIREEINDLVNDPMKKISRFPIYKSERPKVEKILEEYGGKEKFDIEYLENSGRVTMIITKKK